MMRYRPLGDSGIQVSLIALGTMTWGEQNSQAEAFEQLDYALSQGVNLIDTAELYAIPPSAETYGKTETIIGNWLKRSGRRGDVVLASKVAGNSEGWVDHIRGGPRLNRAQMTEALHGSLKRLQTDWLDLYQIHWPAREANYFGKLGVSELADEEVESIEETLGVLNDFVRDGLVRHIGISNETPWGLMQYLCLAEKHGWPRVVSIQNPYNLLNRSFEIGLAEMSLRERVGLLAYSPLGFGALSGKYLHGDAPPDSRLALFPDYQRYTTPAGVEATRRYAALAREAGLSPAQLALAFINSRAFVSANIIGATRMDQLRENIASVDVELSSDLLEAIDAVHAEISNPCP